MNIQFYLFTAYRFGCTVSPSTRNTDTKQAVMQSVMLFNIDGVCSRRNAGKKFNQTGGAEMVH